MSSSSTTTQKPEDTLTVDEEDDSYNTADLLQDPTYLARHTRPRRQDPFENNQELQKVLQDISVYGAEDHYPEEFGNNSKLRNIAEMIRSSRRRGHTSVYRKPRTRKRQHDEKATGNGKAESSKSAASMSEEGAEPEGLVTEDRMMIDEEPQPAIEVGKKETPKVRPTRNHTVATGAIRKRKSRETDDTPYTRKKISRRRVFDEGIPEMPEDGDIWEHPAVPGFSNSLVNKKIAELVAEHPLNRDAFGEIESENF